MQVLDTSTLPATDRAEAFQATVSKNCSSSLASFEDPLKLQAEMHVYELGPAKVFNIDASATTLRRTARHARAMSECEIALALPMRTANHMTWAREERSFGPRDLILVDLSAPYVYGWSGGDGASYAFHVDYDDLDLPMDMVHTAAVQLRSSPLYPLVRDHIARVTADAHRIETRPTAAQVGSASAHLMRALITSAAGDDRRTAETMQASLSARVQAYVQQHLRDPDLTPHRIAAAHGMSVRALYKLFEELEQSLEQFVIEQRLNRVHADLADPRLQHRSIAASAHAWGFTNASYFAKRFRATFGTSPARWRASTASDAGEP